MQHPEHSPSASDIHDEIIPQPGQIHQQQSLIKDKTADLDLCVSEELFARLKEEYNLDEKDKNECGFYHISDIIEIIPNPKDEFTCEEIEGYQVEELKRILEFKKKRNAPKDQPYIEKITKYLEEHKN